MNESFLSFFVMLLSPEQMKRENRWVFAAGRSTRVEGVSVFGIIVAGNF
jgi:hypothetical protein